MLFTIDPEFGGAVVYPDGPKQPDIIVVHDYPSPEDASNGRGLSDAAGRVFWSLLKAMTGMTRSGVYVTSVFKYACEGKFTEEQLKIAAVELDQELTPIPAAYILLVGSVAGKALLGSKWRRMEVHNGRTYMYRNRPTIPVWHPASALAMSDSSKDPMAWIGSGLEGVLYPRTFVDLPPIPPPVKSTYIPEHLTEIAIDTEGTPEKPECVTWATDFGRYFVPAGMAMEFSHSLKQFIDRGGLVWFHNAPWDWQVMESLGILIPPKFRDTMELAYLLQTEPQGLKDLAARYFDYDMKSWEQLVMPMWELALWSKANAIIQVGTTITTHSPKTGKPYKKPKVERATLAKRLHKLKDPKKVAEVLNFPAPSFEFVNERDFADYATLDAFITLHLGRVLSKLV